MTFKISNTYNPTQLDTNTLLGIDFAMSTIGIRDESDKTYDTMPLSQFLEMNPDTFTPYETLNLFSHLFSGSPYELKAGTGQVYTIILSDLCRADPEVFDFVDLEYEQDPFGGYRVSGQ